MTRPLRCHRCGQLLPAVTDAERRAADRAARLRLGSLRGTVSVCAACARAVGVPEQLAFVLDAAS